VPEEASMGETDYDFVPNVGVNQSPSAASQTQDCGLPDLASVRFEGKTGMHAATYLLNRIKPLSIGHAVVAMWMGRAVEVRRSTAAAWCLIEPSILGHAPVPVRRFNSI
jgi:hypothetical protein